MRDTIMFLLGLSILGFLTWFICYDFYLAATGQLTFSIFVRSWVQENLQQPHLFVVAGAILGFAVGIIVGVVLGHLFWT